MAQYDRSVACRLALCPQAQGIISRCLRCFSNGNGTLAIPIRIDIGGPLISGDCPISQSNGVAGQRLGIHTDTHAVFILQHH